VTELDDQPALVVAGDRAVQRLLGGEQALGLGPVVLLLGAGQRQDQAVLSAAGADDVDADLGAHNQPLAHFVGQLLELAGRDDAFGLGADVDQDVAIGHAGDRAPTDLAPARSLHVQRLPPEEGVHRMNIGRPRFVGLAGL
jgi:hypothetical protein